MVEAASFEYGIFQGGITNLRAIEQTALEKGSGKGTGVKTHALETRIYKAAVIERATENFLSFYDKLTMIELAKLKIRLVHRAVYKFTISKNGSRHAGTVIIAVLQSDPFHNGVVENRTLIILIWQ